MIGLVGGAVSIHTKCAVALTRILSNSPSGFTGYRGVRTNDIVHVEGEWVQVCWSVMCDGPRVMMVCVVMVCRVMIVLIL
jgi:hypothetical protein